MSVVASCLSILIDLATSNRSVILSGVFGCLLSPCTYACQVGWIEMRQGFQSASRLGGSDFFSLTRDLAHRVDILRLLADAILQQKKLTQIEALEQTNEVRRPLSSCRLVVGFIHN
jgi:hypothetical protein